MVRAERVALTLPGRFQVTLTLSRGTRHQLEAMRLPVARHLGRYCQVDHYREIEQQGSKHERDRDGESDQYNQTERREDFHKPPPTSQFAREPPETPATRVRARPVNCEPGASRTNKFRPRARKAHKGNPEIAYGKACRGNPFVLDQKLRPSPPTNRQPA